MIKNISISAAYILVLALITLFAGCTPTYVHVDEIGDYWVARPLAELKAEMKKSDSYASKVKWEERTYPMAGGYYGFVQPVDKDCEIHWKINQRDRISGYQAKGTGCQTQKTSDMENINLKSISDQAPSMSPGQRSDWK